jgi:hypothetical protein
MTGRVQIVVDSFEARAYTPYDARAVVKASVLSSLRRWDTTRKCWVIDPCCVPVLANALKYAGLKVFVTSPNGTPWSPPGTSTLQPKQTPAADWIEQAFRACPDRSVERLRKNLLTVWHPDLADGDTKLAQRINGAADARLGKRSR